MGSGAKSCSAKCKQVVDAPALVVLRALRGAFGYIASGASAVTGGRWCRREGAWSEWVDAVMGTRTLGGGGGLRGLPRPGEGWWVLHVLPGGWASRVQGGGGRRSRGVVGCVGPRGGPGLGEARLVLSAHPSRLPSAQASRSRTLPTR